MPAPISVWAIAGPASYHHHCLAESQLNRRRSGESGMIDKFEGAATKVATAAGRPRAFLLALAIVIVWAITGPLFHWSDTWQLVINTGTTIVTFLMVFLIQNAQNRDGGAIQAKLDELIRAVGHARNQFIGIEHLTERELDEIRAALEKVAGDEPTRHAAIVRLLNRLR
jgi:low affinity Fe/Cu permease